MNRTGAGAIPMIVALAIIAAMSLSAFLKGDIDKGAGNTLVKDGRSTGMTIDAKNVFQTESDSSSGRTAYSLGKDARSTTIDATNVFQAESDNSFVRMAHSQKSEMSAESSELSLVAPALNETKTFPKQPQKEEKENEAPKAHDDQSSQKQVWPPEKHEEEQPPKQEQLSTPQEKPKKLQQTVDEPQILRLTDNSTRIVSYTNTPELDRNLCQQFFNGRTCDTIKGNFTDIEQYRSHSTFVNISFSCQHLFKYSGLGSGNYISAFYGMRMAAQVLGSTDVSILCDDAEERKKELITPWVMGVFPRLTPAESAIEEMPSLKMACADYKYIPIGYRWRDMQYEMRRMAIAMIGIPSPDHPSASWAEEHLWSETSAHRHGRNYYQLPTPQKGDAPFFPGTEIDDAMLHYRCGDLVHSNHPSFGFMKFGSFSRHLSPDVRTIGIATQPFEASGQTRPAESKAFTMGRCKQLVMSLVEHLQEKFPKASIRIHNNDNETLALTFARMIMANQTVIAITSFGVFPGVATFGTGYIRKPDFMKAPNRWLLNSPLVEKAGNVRLVEEPVLMAGSVKRMWGENGTQVIQWMQDYTPVKKA